MCELNYYGYRFYSPELGRWLNRDLINEDDGMNLYSMLSNDLNNKMDYLGMACFVELKVPAHIVDPAAYPDNEWKLYSVGVSNWKTAGTAGLYFLLETDFIWRKMFYIGCKCRGWFWDRCFNKYAEREVKKTLKYKISDSTIIYIPTGAIIGSPVPSGTSLANLAIDVFGVTVNAHGPSGAIYTDGAKKAMIEGFHKLRPNDHEMGDGFVEKNPCS